MMHLVRCDTGSEFLLILVLDQLWIWLPVRRGLHVHLWCTRQRSIHGGICVFVYGCVGRRCPVRRNAVALPRSCRSGMLSDRRSVFLVWMRTNRQKTLLTLEDPL